MQAGNVYRVRTTSAVDYIAALTHGGGATPDDLVLPEALAAGRHCRCRVREIRIWSNKAIKWGIQFFASASGRGGSVIDSETYLGEWSFGNTGLPGDGDKATGDTFFYYYMNGLDIAYQDADKSGKLHTRLVNWDAATDKLSHAAGDNIVVEFGLELLQGI